MVDLKDVVGRVLSGDCRDALKDLPDCSVDAVVTDPPYGLGREPDAAEVLEHWLRGDDFNNGGGGFMGRTWDSFVPGPSHWKAVYRVLKPGGHVLAFGGTRTYDLTVMAMRLAGFEIRDQMQWLYASGFPKSLNVSISIAKLVKPEWQMGDKLPAEAEEWAGHGTALKPANEPIVLARRPLSESTIGKNVLRWGTGAINIDGCRISTAGEEIKVPQSDPANRGGVVGQELGISMQDKERFQEAQRASVEKANRLGRWPANVVMSHHPSCVLRGQKQVKNGSGGITGKEPSSRLGTHNIYGESAERTPFVAYGGPDGLETIEDWDCHTDCPIRTLDLQSGDIQCSRVEKPCLDPEIPGHRWGTLQGNRGARGYDDGGGASRFFYQAKATRTERDFGMNGDDMNLHPTVKPVELMRYLCRLITPAAGIVLDPFAGSGSTGCGAAIEGLGFIGVELDPAMAKVAEDRVTKFKESIRFGLAEGTVAMDIVQEQKDEAQGELF